MTTFVSIGNGVQSFSRLLNEVKRISADLPQPVIVQRGSTTFNEPDFRVFDLVGNEEFQSLIRSSTVFITHGGSGSVFTAIKLGKKPIVVPRLKKFNEIIDDHQVTFAEELQHQGKVFAVDNISELLSVVKMAKENPTLPDRVSEDVDPLAMIGETLNSIAPNPTDKICLVTPPGGHLNEILHLSTLFENHPHFFILNQAVVETRTMKGKIMIITFSHRDWRFLVNIKEAFAILRRERPKVILTSGGGFSVAFALAGKVLGIPTVYIETSAKVNVPTMTGRIMYHITRHFFYQWPQVAKHFPKAKYVGLLY